MKVWFVNVLNNWICCSGRVNFYLVNVLLQNNDTNAYRVHISTKAEQAKTNLFCSNYNFGRLTLQFSGEIHNLYLTQNPYWDGENSETCANVLPKREEEKKLLLIFFFIYQSKKKLYFCTRMWGFVEEEKKLPW